MRVSRPAADRPTTPGAPDVMTLEELTKRTGVSVRNVRFYTTRGLLPPPLRRGRSGYYTGDHLARLELLEDLRYAALRAGLQVHFGGVVPGEEGPR